MVTTAADVRVGDYLNGYDDEVGTFQSVQERVREFYETADGFVGIITETGRITLLLTNTKVYGWRSEPTPEVCESVASEIEVRFVVRAADPVEAREYLQRALALGLNTFIHIERMEISE